MRIGKMKILVYINQIIIYEKVGIKFLAAQSIIRGNK